jgi:demethylmenaquinone methyltransferase / 2-methoxy-6-polyprenyl-1,4-benzoquinol methylase
VISPPAGQAPDKGPAVAAMFDRIAPRYDRLNRVLSLGLDLAWRREAVAEALADGPRRVLDLATGTADLAIMLKQARPAACVVGVDFAEAMLAAGRRKLARLGLDVRLTRADALALPFADAAFDALTVAYGLRNFADVSRGLLEMRRVLRAGGRVVVLEFPPPPATGAGRALRWYGRHVMPAIGGLLSGDRSAYAYLPASTEAFLEPAELDAALARAGFTSVRHRLQSLGASALHVGVAA